MKYIVCLDSNFGIEVCAVQAKSIDGVVSIMNNALNHICDFIPVEVCREISWKKLLENNEEALLLGKYSSGNIYARVRKYTGIPEGRPGCSIAYKPY